MTSRRFVEQLDVVEGVGTRLLPLERYTLRAVRSVFSELKKPSFAELSQTSPARLMLQVMPCSFSTCRKFSLSY